MQDDNWKADVKENKEADKDKSVTGDNEDERKVTSRTTVGGITKVGDLPISMGVIPAWLNHESDLSQRIKVYVLLDNSSGGIFVTEQCLKMVNIDGSEMKLTLTTMHRTQEVHTKAAEGLVVTHFNEDMSQNLPRAYARQHIPCRSQCDTKTRDHTEMASPAETQR